MAYETTRLSDIIEPSVYLNYMKVEDPEKNIFVSSGIMASPPEQVRSQMNSGGFTIDMPYWDDLTKGEPDIMSDDRTEEAEPDKLSTGDDIAVKHAWHKSWSSMDLAGLVAVGDMKDPVRHIIERMAGWWRGAEQRALIATLNGVFADNDANDNDDMFYSVYSVRSSDMMSGSPLVRSSQ